MTEFPRVGWSPPCGSASSLMKTERPQSEMVIVCVVVVVVVVFVVVVGL